MRVLTFTDFYLPGFRSGGPLRSLSNLVERLPDEFEFFFVTRDRDAGDVEPYPNVSPGQWQQVGRARVQYVPAPWPGLRRIARILRRTPADVIYLNSFFSPWFTILPLVLRRLGLRRLPVILAPRGEFAPAALALDPIRKRWYLRVIKRTRLLDGVVFQASSEHEAADIRARMMPAIPADRVLVAADVPPLPPSVADRAAESSRDGKLRIAFLSRVSPMKNLHGALAILRDLEVPAHMDIWGPREEAYWAECARAIAALPTHVTAEYKGITSHDQVAALLQNYDVFLLPTLGENYGHAILEALMSGCPVVISDRTPWRDLERERAGFVLPLEQPGRFVQALHSIARWTADERRAWRSSAVAYARRSAGDTTTLDANIFLLQTAASS